MKNSVDNARTTHPTPRVSGPVLKQPTFDWKMPDEYHELNNFEIEVRNFFLINNYNIQDSEKVPIIINWLGCDSLRLVKILNNRKQEKCKTRSGLF